MQQYSTFRWQDSYQRKRNIQLYWILFPQLHGPAEHNQTYINLKHWLIGVGQGGLGPC